MVRWQAEDALIIERDLKAIIGMNDNWDTWQHLTGVQTSFPDGTVLRDYSGANTNTTNVYGGGKANLSIPPCNGSAAQGRRGYAVWAPEGITTNYQNPAIRTVQEWEMANDLGDSHSQSLRQGGALPSNSLECRVVGKIFSRASDTIKIEVYPEIQTAGLEVIVLDSMCNSIDSISGTGPLFFNLPSTYDGWYTVRLRNQTAQQTGQKAWVKVNYLAPESINTKALKSKCACSVPPVNSLDMQENGINLYPNPTSGHSFLNFHEPTQGPTKYEIVGISGKQMDSGTIPQGTTDFVLKNSHLSSGMYFVHLYGTASKTVFKLIKE